MSGSKQRQVVIVGAGLFGCIAADICRHAGRKVVLLDSNEEMSGSKPAACLMKPSWMTGLGKKVVTTGMSVLEELYGVREIEFVVNGLKRQDVFWVPPNKILRRSDKIKDKVVEVRDGIVTTSSGTVYEGEVLVAAGVWTDLLVDIEPQDRLVGAALLYSGKTDPEIHIWAPYRQAVKFNRTPNQIWFGDGTAIKHKNFDYSERVGASINRAEKIFGLSKPKSVIVGSRPYTRGRKGVFEQVYEHTWVSTGGAKNGTILAAYQASLFLEAIS